MRVILFLSLFFIVSCKEKKTEFFVPAKRISVYRIDGEIFYNEVVFVINPPKESKKLINLITQYNGKMTNYNKIIKEYNYFERSFYRESSKTPRDFEDDEGFIPDRIDDHKYDFIGAYSIKKCGNNTNFESSFWSGIGYLSFETIYYKKCE